VSRDSKHWRSERTDENTDKLAILPRIITLKEKMMPYTRNIFTRESKISRKKKERTDQVQNVISLRINDEEKKALEKLTKATSKSISEIMREAIDLWTSKRRKLCID
jgi:hypothetical protein